jgi:hypothetical protein
MNARCYTPPFFLGIVHTVFGTFMLKLLTQSGLPPSATVPLFSTASPPIRHDSPLAVVDLCSITIWLQWDRRSDLMQPPPKGALLHARSVNLCSPPKGMLLPRHFSVSSQPQQGLPVRYLYLPIALHLHKVLHYFAFVW